MRKLFCDLIWIEIVYLLFPRQNAVFFDPSFVNPVLIPIDDMRELSELILICEEVRMKSYANETNDWNQWWWEVSAMWVFFLIVVGLRVGWGLFT